VPSSASDAAPIRRHTAVLVLVGCGLLAVLVIGTRAVLAEVTEPAPTNRSALCAELDVLMARTTSGAVFATQQINHSARRLSQLADRYETDSDPSRVALAGADIRTVLGSVAWETADLVTATRPIALECGWNWPVSSTPPAPQPSPPSS
jgi:hypothetical protein